MALDKNALVVVLMILILLLWPTDKILSKILADLLGDQAATLVVPTAAFGLLFNGALLGYEVGVGRVKGPMVRKLCSCGASWSAIGPGKYLVLSGVSGICGNISGLTAQPYVTVFMDQLMCQSTVLWTLAISMWWLGTRYIAQECLAVFVLFFAACSGGFIGVMSDPSHNDAFWAIFDTVTCVFAGIAYVLKELTFRKYAELPSSEDEGGDALDVEVSGDDEDGEDQSDTEREGNLNVILAGFVVAVASLVVVAPAKMAMHACTHKHLPGEPNEFGFLVEGLQKIFSDKQTCSYFFLYTIVNLAHQLVFLLLSKYGSALTCSICLKVCTPLIAILSSFDWPVIGAHPVDPLQWIVMPVMFTAAITYRHGTLKREGLGVNQCCWPMGLAEELDDRMKVVEEMQRQQQKQSEMLMKKLEAAQEAQQPQVTHVRSNMSSAGF
jgi:hypothetical protein